MSQLTWTFSIMPRIECSKFMQSEVCVAAVQISFCHGCKNKEQSWWKTHQVSCAFGSVEMQKLVIAVECSLLSDYVNISSGHYNSAKVYCIDFCDCFHNFKLSAIIYTFLHYSCLFYSLYYMNVRKRKCDYSYESCQSL